MLVRFPGFAPPIARLFALANTPFDPTTFRIACEAIAPFDAHVSDDDLWSFPLHPGGEPRLIVQLKPDLSAVECAILSICWWEEPAEDREMVAAERAEFDRLYEEAFAGTVAALGAPLLGGSDAVGGYRHALWRVGTGLLALQQSCYDPQFGDDINFWVREWSGSDPKPTSPFIDWVMR